MVASDSDHLKQLANKGGQNANVKVSKWKVQNNRVM